VDLFSRWKAESVKFTAPKYQEKVQLLTNDLFQACTVYQDTLQLASEEADAGATAAHDIVYLLDQLVERAPSEEIVELLEDLDTMTERLLKFATELKDKFISVRGALVSARLRLPELRNEIEADRDALRHQQLEAQRGAASATANSKFAASVLITGATLLAPLTLGASLALGASSAAVLSAGSAVALGVGGAISDSLTHQANEYERQYQALENLIAVLHDLELGLAAGIESVGRHIAYWTWIQSQIKAATINPDRLINNQGLIKVAMAKKRRQGWSEIEEKYRKYCDTAISSRQVLQLTMEG